MLEYSYSERGKKYQERMVTVIKTFSKFLTFAFYFETCRREPEIRTRTSVR